MDFLNKAFAQLSELFRGMSPGARLTSGLLLAMVVVSGGFLANHQVTGGDAYLLEGQNFSTAELQAIQSAFGQAGLNNYDIEGGRVRVPRSQRAKYLAALVDANAMPAHFGSHFDAAVSKPSPFTSKAQQEAMIKNAVQKDLAAVISQMKGIETASVLYDAQKKGGLRLETTTTASVSVKPIGDSALPADQVPKIRALVAGAIANLAPEQVTVVDLNGRSYPATGSKDVHDVFDDPYAQRVKYWQNFWETTLMQALEYVPGVVVTANVELDPRTRLEEEKTHVDPKTVPITVQEDTDTEQTDAASPSGQPGIQSQRANAPATLPAQARGNHTEKERNSRREQNDASRDWTKTTTAPLTPKRVTVTVAVPSSYFEKVYRDQIPSTPGEPAAPIDKKALAQIQTDETSKIQKHVAALMPQSDVTADPRPLVTVTTFHQLPGEAIPAPSMADVAMSWLAGNWSTAGMVGLALFSLAMLRSMVRSAPLPAAVPDLPLPPSPAPTEKAAEKTTEEQETKGGNRLKRRTGSGQSLREELAEMVKEDPDTAASILRTWIGNVN